MRTMNKMTYFNSYLSHKNKSIIYNVLKTDDGWNVEILLPSNIPPSDRIKILDWIRSYRVQVRAEHPLWSTVLHPSLDCYVLEIRRTNNDKELIATGEQLKSICGEILEYA